MCMCVYMYVCASMCIFCNNIKKIKKKKNYRNVVVKQCAINGDEDDRDEDDGDEDDGGEDDGDEDDGDEDDGDEDDGDEDDEDEDDGDEKDRDEDVEDEDVEDEDGDEDDGGDDDWDEDDGEAYAQCLVTQQHDVFSLLLFSYLFIWIYHFHSSIDCIA